jgi:hypothetical protein
MDAIDTSKGYLRRKDDEYEKGLRDDGRGMVKDKGGG